MTSVRFFFSSHDQKHKAENNKTYFNGKLSITNKKALKVPCFCYT